MVTNSTANAQQAIENALAITLLASVWLAPNHQAPWSSFHHELLMAIALAATCGLLGWQTRWRLPMPMFARLVLVASLLPWLQWATGLLPKSGTALVSSVYIAALGVAICVGCAGAREASGQRLFAVLFGALALAAFFNVPIQLIQWYQWYEHDLETLLMLFVTPIGAFNRPSGMILQPNQLATIQVWGLIGVSWFRYRGRISLPFFLLTFVFISFGVGLTQSRAGLLEMLVVFCLLSLAFRSVPKRDIVWTWGAATATLLVWGLNFATVAEWLGVRSKAVARLSSIDGARLDAWRAFWGAVLERPLSGYGVTDSGFAYVALAQEQPGLFFGQRFAHAHNVLLDMVLWVGLPLGLLIAGGVTVWLVRRLLAVSKLPQTVFPLAVVLSLALHAMLELPHQFLYFIVPAGICIGWLTNFEFTPMSFTLPRWVWSVTCLLSLVVIAPIVRDYFPYQERYTEWRFENQRVGNRPDTAIHQPLVLNQIHDELVLYRMPLDVDLTVQQLEWVAKTASSVNSPPAYFAAAKAFALAGQNAEAKRWMMRYNAIMDASDVSQIKEIWQRDQERQSNLIGLSWPDYQGRPSNFVMPPLDASPNLIPARPVR